MRLLELGPVLSIIEPDENGANGEGTSGEIDDVADVALFPAWTGRCQRRLNPDPAHFP
ncbi:hypothetical protein ACGFIY_33640 [Micromonospora chersina]|uniref:hypothetical protein n=1 Tax=Micromonospora chersina TaxID=47854 RepID=UPI00370FC168